LLFFLTPSAFGISPQGGERGFPKFLKATPILPLGEMSAQSRQRGFYLSLINFFSFPSAFGISPPRGRKGFPKILKSNPHSPLGGDVCPKQTEGFYLSLINFFPSPLPSASPPKGEKGGSQNS